MTYRFFINHRIHEARTALFGEALEMVEPFLLAVEEAVRIDALWPVYVEASPSPPAVDFDRYLVSNSMALTKRFEWVVTRDYQARFGIRYPGSPIIQAFLERYRHHPDFKAEWLPHV